MKYTNPVLGSKIDTELTLKVVILKIIFFNSENYYGVCECKDDNGHTFVATGKFPMSLYEGQSYEFIGKVVFQRGSNQLSVTSYKNILPFDRSSMISYLSTLPNIKSKAILIYQAYGNDSLQILKTDPNRVAKEIKGIGKTTAKRAQEALLLMNISEKAILKLLEYGLTPIAARKLYDIFGEQIIDKIEENPYFLLAKVKGYGFNKCDAIAEQLGYNMHSEERIKAGILYTLELAKNDGHCYLPPQELIEKACNTLSKKLTTQTMAYIIKNNLSEYTYNNKKYSVDIDAIKECYRLETQTKHFGIDYRYKIIEIMPNEIEVVMERMIKSSDLVFDVDKIYLPFIYHAERYVEEKIIKINDVSSYSGIDASFIIQRLEIRTKCSLEPEQKSAIENFLSRDGGIFVLTGSAGCGKTFTMKLFIEALKSVNASTKIKLFAPTGKAAKVLKNATGYECMTIHRGLEYTPEIGFMKNEFNPIDADVIVVDEASMLDIELLFHFLKAVTVDTKLIFLGDVNQLQSVGCGNVLNDFLQSKAVRINELKTIKRQSLDSGIIMNANNIIQSKMPNNNYNDFNLITLENEDDLMEEVIKAYVNTVKSGVSIEDVQLLTPQKNNSFGTYNLNKRLQELINPYPSLEIPYKTVGNTTLVFKERDKVIHIKNNYDKQWFINTPDGYEPIDEFGIFNGDCGIVESIYLNPITKKYEMFVRYENKYMLYANDDFEEVELAYALTIHKSQGSEWQHVIIPMLRQHYAMLNKHLLYTAITRAKTNLALIGQKSAIETAINRSTLQTRYTNLNI